MSLSHSDDYRGNVFIPIAVPINGTAIDRDIMTGKCYFPFSISSSTSFAP
jgi:hypothetical protein